MQPYRESGALKPIYLILWQLGVTPCYRGYYYAASAALWAKLQPEALLLITKCLYPDVAKQYQTDWRCVERNLRTIIDIAWKQNSALLSALAGFTLTKKPCCTQFISILARALELPAKNESYGYSASKSDEKDLFIR